MPQLKGSLCSCGCGQRKTSQKKRFAAGHNMDARQRRYYRSTAGGRPPAPSKKVPRNAWSPEPNIVYEGVIDFLGARGKTFPSFYFATLAERNERCFISTRIVPRGLRVGDRVRVTLKPNDDSAATPGGARWKATKVVQITESQEES